MTQLFEGQSEANLAQVQIEIGQTDEGRLGQLDTPWRKIWDEERKILMDRLKSESQLLLNQVLLELKDSRSFRVSAQRARAKETPTIPKTHEEMDPEKVNSFL